MTSDTAEAKRGFLHSLHQDDLALILKHTRARLYDTGEHAVHAGEVDRSVFIVARGSFEVVLGTGNDRRQARMLERGDLFGEVSFFDGRPRTADVVALEPSEALILTPAAFERLRLSCPRLALHFTLDLGRILGERFRASDAVSS